MTERGKRKAKYAPLASTDDTRKQKQTIKTTLHSILHQDLRSEFKPILEAYLLQINQLRVATSLVIKHHWLSLLSRPSEDILPFELDQYYFTYVFNSLRGSTKLKGKEAIDPTDIKESVDAITTRLHWKFEPDPCLTSESLFSSQASILGNEYVRVYRTHIKTHLEGALRLWKRNQFIARLSQEEVDKTMKSSLSRLNKYQDDSKELQAFLGEATFQRFTDYKNQVQEWMLTLTATESNEDLDLLEPNTVKKLKKASELPTLFFEQGLKLMWEMRRDTELLEVQAPQRPFKSISLFPEYDCKVNYVQLDTTILHWFYNMLHPFEKSEAWEHEKVWSYFFSLDRIRKLKAAAIKHGRAAFEFTMMVDGIGASVIFTILKPSHNKRSKQPPRRKRVLTSLRPGLYGENWVLERYQNFDESQVGFISADPGVVNMNQWCNLQSETDPRPEFPKSFSQREYRHHTQNQFVRNTETSLRLIQAPLRDHLKATPFCRTAHPDKFLEYVRTVGLYWDHTWMYAADLKFRWARFERFKRSQRFMDRWLQDSEKIIGDRVVLMGNGACKKQGFGRVRGGGVKGPVKKFQLLLSRRHPVVMCSEFRTTKCCVTCGRELFHPKGVRLKRDKKTGEMKRVSVQLSGVSYCRETDHHAFVSRDKDAARKIGLRFLCRLVRGADCDLGVWSRQVKWANAKPSSALAEIRRQVLSPSRETKT
jgi:hypothetical protein